MTEPGPIVVVLAPDVLGRSFEDAACARILVSWRDGRLVPAVNRQLLRRYLKVLQDLGLSGELLRRWGWWFTAADRVRFLEAFTVVESNACELCVEVARTAGAAWIIATENPQGSRIGASAGVSVEPNVSWISPQAFLDGPGVGG